MKKIIIVLLVQFSCIHYSLAQIENQVDSLVQVFCDALESEPIIDPDKRVDEVLIKHVYPFMEKLDGEERKSMAQLFYFRGQRNCRLFQEYMYNLDKRESDWVMLDGPMEIKITKKEHKTFFKNENFKYLEANGDEVNVILSKERWIDRFKNGTYSKLKLNILDVGTFELVFEESNNEIRSNMSIVGDRYLYKIISKESGFYYVTVEVPGKAQYFLFKMYF